MNKWLKSAETNKQSYDQRSLFRENSPFDNSKSVTYNFDFSAAENPNKTKYIKIDVKTDACDQMNPTALYPGSEIGTYELKLTQFNNKQCTITINPIIFPFNLASSTDPKANPTKPSDSNQEPSESNKPIDSESNDTTSNASMNYGAESFIIGVSAFLLLLEL